MHTKRKREEPTTEPGFCFIPYAVKPIATATEIAAEILEDILVAVDGLVLDAPSDEVVLNPWKCKEDGCKKNPVRLGRYLTDGIHLLLH